MFLLMLEKTPKHMECLELNYYQKKMPNSVLIPEGYAHGYSTISEESIVVYLQSDN